MNIDKCPTCGRRRDGSRSWLDTRRVYLKRGRVRASVRRYSPSWRRLRDLPRDQWPPTRVRPSVTIRINKMAAAPSKGDPRYYPTTTWIRCIDKWHTNPPVVVERRQPLPRIHEPERSKRRTRRHRDHQSKARR